MILPDLLRIISGRAHWAVKHTFYISVKHIVPVRLRNIGEKLLLRDARVVHQNFNRPEHRFYLSEHIKHLFSVGNIRLHCDCRITRNDPVDFLNQRFCFLFIMKIIHSHTVAVLCETARDFTADSA